MHSYVKYFDPLHSYVKYFVLLYTPRNTGIVSILDVSGVISEAPKHGDCFVFLCFHNIVMGGYAVTLLLLRSNKNVEMKKSNKIGGLILVTPRGCCFDTLYFFVTSGLLRVLHAMYMRDFRYMRQQSE